MLELIKSTIQRPYLAMLIAGVLGGLAQLMLPLSIVSSAMVCLYILRKGERAGFWVMLVAAIIIYQMSLVIESKGHSLGWLGGACRAGRHGQGAAQSLRRC